MTRCRVLVITVVHAPLDARIHARQIAALRDDGWRVTYAAPWTDTGTPRDDRLRTLDLPRAVGRRRLPAMRAARRLVREEASQHDLILVHDPEVLVALAGMRDLPPVVWDVHEDVAAALDDRAWVPAVLRPVLRSTVRWFERWADRHHALLLAEDSYRSRFEGDHPVIRNVPRVPAAAPPPGPGRAVYIGRISPSRGLTTLLALPDHLPSDVIVELVGTPDPDVADELRAAHDAGRVCWHGYLPNDEALELLSGATVGMSLLSDEPNFRGSLPTKVAEYLARGVPVITTPLPEAVRLVESSGGGTVVPFDDVPSVAAAILHYHRSEDARHATGQAGHAWAQEHLVWESEARRLLQALAGAVGSTDAA